MRKGRRASVLTTLVFTDIVSSTEIAEEMGDRRWQELLSHHYQVIRRTLREHDGKERDTAGDGVFASFESPAAAVRWACAAVDALRELGVWIRVGIHIGEAEVLQGKLSGSTYTPPHARWPSPARARSSSPGASVTSSVEAVSASRTAAFTSCEGSTASGTCSR
jgi:Adenylate and Guanylate cyclase catalytic domain